MIRDLYIISKIEDIWWNVFKRKKMWNDVQKCEQIFCKACGGKFID